MDIARDLGARACPGRAWSVAGRDYNPTPNNRLEECRRDRGRAGSFWYAGIGTNDGMGCRNQVDLRHGGQARSRHPGGVQRLLRATATCSSSADSISQRTWVLLQSTNDGEVPGNDY